MDILIKKPDIAISNWVFANDFGVDIKSEDNTVALNNAIEYCHTNKINCLKFNEGVYRFDNPKNINMNDLKDFTFEGCNSEFVFASPGQFHIKDCSQVLICNIFVDWDWNYKRLASLIKIISCNHDTNSIIVEFIELEKIDLEFEFVTMNQFDEKTLTAGTSCGKEFWADKLKIKEKRPAKKPNQMEIIYCAGSFPEVRVNEIYLVRHQHRQKAFFAIEDSSDIAFEFVTVYSVPGMCFYICGQSHHLKFFECKIQLKEGENRRLSSEADGIHVAESCGNILIEHCDFSFMGDDSINIHICLGFVFGVRDKRALILENYVNCKEGDTFKIRRNNFEESGKTSKLLEVKTEGEKFVYYFEEDLPEEVKEGYLLSNTSFDSSNYIIRNNNFHDHRARGLLLQDCNGIVENNRFYGLQGAAIYIMTETLRNLWYEGNGAKNIIIRNNVFDYCNKNNWTSIIDIMAVIPDLKSEYPVFENISIYNNIFKDFTSSVFYINKAQNVSIYNNSFRTNKISKENHEKSGVIFVNLSSDVKIDKNTWSISNEMPNGGKIDYNPKGDGSLYRAVANMQL